MFHMHFTILFKTPDSSLTPDITIFILSEADGTITFTSIAQKFTYNSLLGYKIANDTYTLAKMLLEISQNLSPYLRYRKTNPN